MNNISEKMISIEEAKTALRCMRLGGLDEIQALETLDELAMRVRKLTTAKIVESIIENNLTQTQAEAFKRYWYDGENTAQIARELNVSQPNVYKTLMRANETIKSSMSALIQYQNDLADVKIVPIHIDEALEILSAQKRGSKSLGEALRNLRVSYAITPQNLASNLKISQKELTDIENGLKIPSAVIASRYTALFNVEIIMEFVNGRGRYICRQH